MNIISQEVIKSPVEWPSHIIALLVIMAALTILILSIVTKQPEKWRDKMLAVSYGGICLFLTVYFLGHLVWAKDSDRYRYEATLDDTYSVNELYENYTNIKYDPETKIYTFEDKENE